ncbi:hypothetical protein GCM10009719_08790 [Nocardioides kribbensis]
MPNTRVPSPSAVGAEDPLSELVELGSSSPESLPQPASTIALAAATAARRIVVDLRFICPPGSRGAVVGVTAQEAT